MKSELIRDDGTTFTGCGYPGYPPNLIGKLVVLLAAVEPPCPPNKPKLFIPKVIWVLVAVPELEKKFAAALPNPVISGAQFVVVASLLKMYDVPWVMLAVPLYPGTPGCILVVDAEPAPPA
jgi:hypothetical protein